MLLFYRCTPRLSQVNSPKVQIECRGEDGPIAVPGRFLHIRDERQVHDFYFALCEIEIYGLPGTFSNQYNCGFLQNFKSIAHLKPKRLRLSWLRLLKLLPEQLVGTRWKVATTSERHCPTFLPLRAAIHRALVRRCMSVLKNLVIIVPSSNCSTTAMA